MLGVVTVDAPTTRPTSSCASSGARSAPTARTPRRASASTSARRARPWRTRSSAARARARTGCIACGRCMVGCPHNAKNTLPKNYLWLAERAGARIVPERTVVDIAPLGAARRLGRLRGHDRAHRRLVAPRPPRAHRARRRRRRRPARHEQAAGRLQAARLAAARLGPPRRARAHELRGDPRRHAPARRARDDQARGDLLERLSRTPTRTSRPSPTATRATRMSALYTLMVGDGTRLTRPLKLLGARPAPPRPPARG